MTRGVGKTMAGGLVVLAVSSMLLSPAWGGASWFDPSADELDPGDQVTMVGFTSGGQLGWIEDGPFFGFVNPESDQAGSVAWNNFGDHLIPVGQLTIDEVGNHDVRVHVTFPVPELDDGTYAFEYCNDPCSTGLGDLVGGALHVGVAGDTYDATDPRYVDLVPAALAATGSSVRSLLLLGWILVLIGSAAVGFGMWRSRARS